MDCKQAKELIKDYIEAEEEPDAFDKLYEHITNCADCRDEIEVMFLVKQGLKRLEDGEAFDLKKELDRKLQYSMKLFVLARRIRIIISIASLIILMILVGLLIDTFIFR